MPGPGPKRLEYLGQPLTTVPIPLPSNYVNSAAYARRNSQATFTPSSSLEGQNGPVGKPTGAPMGAEPGALRLAVTGQGAGLAKAKSPVSQGMGIVIQLPARQGDTKVGGDEKKTGSATGGKDDGKVKTLDSAIVREGPRGDGHVEAERSKKRKRDDEEPPRKRRKKKAAKTSNLTASKASAISREDGGQKDLKPVMEKREAPTKETAQKGGKKIVFEYETSDQEEVETITQKKDKKEKKQTKGTKGKKSKKVRSISTDDTSVGEDDDPAKTTQSKKKSRKDKVTKKKPSKETSSDESTSEDEKTSQRAKKQKKKKERESKRRKPKTSRRDISSEDTSDDEDVSKSKQKQIDHKRTKRSKKHASKPSEDDTTDEDSSSDEQVVKKEKKKIKQRQEKAKKKKKKHHKPPVPSSASESDSEDSSVETEQYVLPATRTPKTKNAFKSESTPSPGHVRSKPILLDSDLDEKGDGVLRAYVQVPVRSTASRIDMEAIPPWGVVDPSKAVNVNSPVELPSEAEEQAVMDEIEESTGKGSGGENRCEDEEEDDVPVSRKRSTRQLQSMFDDEASDDGSSDEEDDIRVDSGKKPADSHSLFGSDVDKREKLGKDVENTVQPSSAPTPGRRLQQGRQGVPSSPTRRHMTEKEKKRELLKQRRQGKNVTMSDLDAENEDEAALYDSDDGFHVLKVFPDEEQKVPKTPASKPKNRHDPEPTERSFLEEGQMSSSHGLSSPRNDDEDDDDDDLEGFIADDDEDSNLSDPVLIRAEMPIEFTRDARKPLKDHFHDALEWLVMDRLNPAFDRTAPIYHIAWRRLDDEIGALVSSRFISSSWTPGFIRALKARPGIVSTELEPNTDVENKCEACNRSRHPPTLTIKFLGKPYSGKTLEELSYDSPSDSEAEQIRLLNGSNKKKRAKKAKQEKAAYDVHGALLEPTSKRWRVGSHCGSNAIRAHQLVHWKKSLKIKVEDKLEAGNMFSASALKSRDRMTNKARRNLALGLLDLWDRESFTNELFSQWMRSLEEARTESAMPRERFKK